MPSLAANASAVIPVSGPITLSCDGPGFARVTVDGVVQFEGPCASYMRSFAPPQASITLLAIGRDIDYDVSPNTAALAGSVARVVSDASGAITGFVRQSGGIQPIGAATSYNEAAGLVTGKFALAGSWKTALARVRGGSGSAKVLLVGDSTHAGTGSDATAANYRPNGPGKIIADSLAALGERAASYQNFFGTSFNLNSSAINSWDGRFTNITGMTGIGGPSVGGFSPYGNGGFRFTPGGTFDTAEIYYIRAPGLGSFALSSNLGSHGSTDTNGAASIQKITVSLGGAAQWVAFAMTGNVAIIGADLYTAGTPAVRVLNGGWGGSTAANWNDTTYTYGPPGAIQSIAPDLVLINLGINEWVTSVAATTFATNLRTLVDTCRASGTRDVAIQTQFTTRASVVPTATQDTYAAAARSVALATGCPLIDIRRAYGSWEALNAQGLVFDDNHPGPVAYQTSGALIAATLVVLGN